MASRYWLIHPNGGRQYIDPRRFDLEQLAEQARRTGGRLVIERDPELPESSTAALAVPIDPTATPQRFEPPISALAALFRGRLDQIYLCDCDFVIDVNSRSTTRALGRYYKRRRLVRIYAVDKVTGRRPLEEIFDTFLHEVAHHLEYTEPHAFNAEACGRVHGLMHSPLFWLILGELKRRWIELQRFGHVSALLDP